MRLIALLLLVFLPTVIDAQRSTTLDVQFAASADSFRAATEEYQAIWARDGSRIVVAMERATGLQFEAGPIEASVYEGTSLSGIRDQTPMRLRASYSTDTKRATLVHGARPSPDWSPCPWHLRRSPSGSFCSFMTCGWNSPGWRSRTSRCLSRESAAGRQIMTVFGKPHSRYLGRNEPTASNSLSVSAAGRWRDKRRDQLGRWKRRDPLARTC